MRIPAEKYIEGVNSIYEEQPEYRTGGDGSDGTCDCIGMCRGALEREGVTGITNMRGTNQAARKTIEDLRAVGSVKDLRLGDVVLKTRDKDDKTMPLPDRYRKGGADYDPKWGETNFTHIGSVTGVDPLEITHMTSPTAKKDTSLGNWKYSGSLPWVEHGADPGPSPEPSPVPVTEWATVTAEKGESVKMRAKPSTSCRLYWDVPVGSSVMVLERDAGTSGGETWSRIRWAGQDGYMMQRFLLFADADPAPGGCYTVIVQGLSQEAAEELAGRYPGALIVQEGEHMEGK